MASEDVQLIPVKPAEREEFMRMAERHFAGLNSSFFPQEDWKRSYFDTILSGPHLFLRWIVSGGERAGFILYGIEPHRFLPRKTGAIYELYVEPEKRLRGIARHAAQIAIRELQSYSPSKIQLEVVEGNSGAAALWMSLGFKKVTERFVLTSAV
jgi:ribosomal protein S18 acetylase RimI-like enzyme